MPGAPSSCSVKLAQLEPERPYVTNHRGSRSASANKDNGGSVRLEGNVDHRPYMRRQNFGWVASQTINLQETIYSITTAGKAALLQP